MPYVEDNTEKNVIDLMERAAGTFHELYSPIMLHLSSYEKCKMLFTKHTNLT